MHIAELTDKTRSEFYTYINTNNEAPHQWCQLFAIIKTLHAQTEILLFMTRYYKDQIPDILTVEALESSLNGNIEQMREYQEAIRKLQAERAKETKA